MRRTAVERLGRKPQEYADISRLSDDVFRQRGKQKIRVVNWGSNNIQLCGYTVPLKILYHKIIANATAQAISLIAKASEEQGGNTAINLKVAEQYIDAFSNLAKTNNTLIVPSNLSDVSGMVGSVMKIVQSTKTTK